MIRKISTFVFLCLCFCSAFVLSAGGHVPEWTHPLPLRADSSNFVTASMLVADPGPELYSHVGHCTLRMECPAYDLDYCFSFEVEATTGNYFRFFGGTALGHVVATPTAEYLAEYKSENRRVMQYELNLSTAQKKRLWQLLDEGYMDPQMRKYNFLQNNCLSVSFNMVEGSLGKDDFLQYVWPKQLSVVNGDVVRNSAINSPWFQFISLMIFGDAADDTNDNRQRMYPSIVPEVLAGSTIRNYEGDVRPLLAAKPRVLLPGTFRLDAPVVTPMVIFGLLLVITVVVTVFYLRGRLLWPVRLYFGALLVSQALLGLVLCYMSAVSSLFGTHWNWYLLVFNPLPALLWLVLRGRAMFPRLCLAYGVGLLLFVLCTPFSAQLSWEHQLITLSLALPALACYLRSQKTDEGA